MRSLETNCNRGFGILEIPSTTGMGFKMDRRKAQLAWKIAALRLR